MEAKLIPEKYEPIFQYGERGFRLISKFLVPNDIEFIRRHCRPGPAKTFAEKSNWTKIPERLLWEADQKFKSLLDRDIRDFIVYGWLVLDDVDAGHAMFELGPAEIIRWHWEEFYDPPSFNRRNRS